jgi:uncharacterized membrane protein
MGGTQRRWRPGEGTLLVWLSLGAGIALISQMAVTQSGRLGFLPWNLMLAWVPYGISRGIRVLERRTQPGAGVLVLPTCAWLLFFPNAPYIVTDLVHLADAPPGRFGIELAMIVLFAAIAMALAVRSLDTMHAIVRRRLGVPAGWTFATVVVLLTGLGVWMGRVLRWNTWDFARDPLGLVATTFRSLVSAETAASSAAFILAFSAGLFSIYRSAARPGPDRPPPR